MRLQRFHNAIIRTSNNESAAQYIIRELWGIVGDVKFNSYGIVEFCVDYDIFKDEIANGQLNFHWATNGGFTEIRWDDTGYSAANFANFCLLHSDCYCVHIRLVKKDGWFETLELTTICPERI